MKRIFYSSFFLLAAVGAFSQTSTAPVLPEFLSVKTVKATPVRNQAMTGTCWCFSTTSLLESDVIKKTNREVDLSEMYTVRNIYMEKAKNYVLRQGKTQFGEGGLGHDMIHAVALYGAIPEASYSGLVNGQKVFNHQKLVVQLQQYLDSVIKKTPISSNWMQGYVQILDAYMGAAPTSFTWNGSAYTPQSFAKDALKFNESDYVSFTSFTHQPYYKPFILQVPDNFANGAFYNLPMEEMVELIKTAVNNGYSVAWDADVSNNGFHQELGLALNLDQSHKYNKEEINADMPEQYAHASTRQQLYETLVTQDDHLMHIVGVEKSKSGKNFFIVKNSWGEVGPYKGYINVSEAYVGINTISIVVPKAALSKVMLSNLHIQ